MNYYIHIDNAGKAISNPVLESNLAFLIDGEVTPEKAAVFNYVPILDNKPELAANQRAEYIGYSRKETGEYSMDWEVVTLDQNELLNELIRRRRDFELAASDWTQVADVPLTAEQKAAWASYRQALRNLTTTYSDATVAEDIIWPTKPT